MLWQYLAACGRKENPRGVTYVIKEVDGSFKGRIAVQICSGSCVKGKRCSSLHGQTAIGPRWKGIPKPLCPVGGNLISKKRTLASDRQEYGASCNHAWSMVATSV